MNFFENLLKMQRYILNCASMKKYEVKNFGAFIHVFLPLGLFAE